MKISLLLSALALTAVLILSGQQAPGSGQQAPDAGQQAPEPGQQFPDGEGKDLVLDLCSGCHGLDQVAAYHGSKDEWGAMVYAMTGRGLVVTGEENDQIVEYLAKNFPPAKKVVAPLPDGEGKDLVMARCAGCHGIDQVEAHSGTKEDWASVVNYMLSQGLAATPEETTRIVAYLAKNFAPPAKEGADAKGKTESKAKGKTDADPAKADPPKPTDPPK